MNILKKNDITWFLTDETLNGLVKRLAPGEADRRSHWCVEEQGRRVFVKYFVEKGLTGALRNGLYPRGKREYLLGRKLASFNIRTPAPLGYGVASGGSFILQEYIDAVPFKDAFNQAPDRRDLLEGLALLLKQMREHRVRHNDLHLENVMVQEGRLWLIDLHKTRVRKSRFSTSDELVNLTHALTMIYPDLEEDEKRRFFADYGRPDVRGATEGGLLALWEAWIESKKRRAFSTTSKLAASRTGVRLLESAPVQDSGTRELLKKDKKVTVEAFGDHITKTYRDKRRFVRAWQAHVVLEYLEMAVGPRPFGCRRASLFRKGSIAMENLKGRGEELDRFLDRHHDTMTLHERLRFVDALARFLKGLLVKGVAHRDVKACNLFVLADGFRLLDIEDVQFRLPVTEKDVRRMLIQLNCSVPARIGVFERMRFFAVITRGLVQDRKGLLAEVAQASAGEEIVYEGTSGLIRESWRDSQRDSLR